ncbi:metal ABC transporter permease [Tannockella kyphosi]|uniref:metal ABC transporter permease n=1 Tax=Tannockella kyphosi TaxID=2899121 RepID=UPI002011E847|nr:metal ABC transporter permease [Tannockella kyphosi]
MEIISKIMYYLQYPFVVYALVVGVLIALCSSLFGVTLVLKRFSYIGDGLSHVAFGAVSISAVLNLTVETPLVLLLTGLSAIFLLRTGESKKVQGDAAIAMISVGTLGVGYLLLNVFSTSVNVAGDVCTSLFGSTSILTLNQYDVILSGVLSIVVVVLFVLYYHRIFSVTFDENFSNATGTNAKKYNLMIAVIIAVIIVLAMNLVGSLLISALIIFPALASMQVFKSFLSVTISSTIFSVVCTVLGILISILFASPVGATIVVVDICVFFIYYFIGCLLNTLTR